MRERGAERGAGRAGPVAREGKGREVWAGRGQSWAAEFCWAEVWAVRGEVERGGRGLGWIGGLGLALVWAGFFSSFFFSSISNSNSNQTR